MKETKKELTEGIVIKDSSCHFGIDKALDTVVRNIWFLSPLVPSKQEKDIQTETTYLVCLLLQNKSFVKVNIDVSALKNV